MRRFLLRLYHVFHLSDNVVYYLLLLTFFILFSVNSYVNLDSDFGWHIRMGQIITSVGIPKTDPFSYTMPSYPFIDHEWLSEMALLHLYNSIHLLGLALLFGGIGIIPLITQKRFYKGKLTNLLIMLEGATLINFIGIRMQLISWVYFVTALLFFNEKRWKTWRWFFPILMLIWTNTHGSFPLGIIVLSFFMIAKIVNKQLTRSDIIIASASIFITLLSPYGLLLWEEVVKQFSDPSQRGTVSEWTPTVLIMIVPMWIYLVFSGIFIMRYFHKLLFYEKLLYAFFVLLGLSGIRNISYLLFVSFPLTIQAFGMFLHQIKPIPFAQKRATNAFSIFFMLSLLLTIGYTALEVEGNYYAGITYKATCPPGAIAYLKTHKTPGQLFSHYNWGGCLIWLLPQKKVFIDGRMPSWKWNGPKGESNYAFADYQHILAGSLSFTTIAKKYHITEVLLPVYYTQDPQPDPELELTKKLPKWLQFTTGIQQINLDKKLRKANFYKIYQDEYAVIYQKR